MSKSLTLNDLARDIKKWIKEGYGDCTLVVSQDSEGNGFSPLGGVSLDMVYYPEDGEVCGEDEEGRPEGGDRAIVIWPEH